MDLQKYSFLEFTKDREKSEVKTGMPYFRRLFALEPIEYRDLSFPIFIRYLFVCSTTWTSILG